MKRTINGKRLLILLAIITSWGLLYIGGWFLTFLPTNVRIFWEPYSISNSFKNGLLLAIYLFIISIVLICLVSLFKWLFPKSDEIKRGN